MRAHPKLNVYQLVSLLPLLVLLAHFFSTAHSQADLLGPCREEDKRVLIRIKRRLGSPPSLGSWDLKNSEWSGISCDENHFVTSVSFLDSDIPSIPPFLDHLPALTELRFEFTSNLNGTIPRYFAKLTNLTNFGILFTNVGGHIPSFLGQLTNLKNLELPGNKFTGKIPSSLGQLSGLTKLDLSQNQLTGSIPPTLANLTNLGELYLYSNSLSGRIPDIGQRLVKLARLDLGNNQLTGRIPVSLGMAPLTSLLFLTRNKLIGPVPRSLARADRVAISLGQNELTGDASFLMDKNNSALHILDISNNRFEFDLSKVDLAPELGIFKISHNMIYGSLPKLFYRIIGHSPYPIESFVDVSYNQLCGPIPNGRRLKQINLKIFANNKCLCGGPLPACK